ncbi:hypothetical protein TSUD_254930 [Trifolium subterraneum]|uniref:Reverse transcriptase zinc-binding domain-containing protein n=1 Tax=Trifolium subterraneum TaxID=3900 RepID=A0A2Z6MHL5_TRISU|nr:hypothetical protein TSUD_254930 [Trifolium subterraneum]
MHSTSLILLLTFSQFSRATLYGFHSSSLRSKSCLVWRLFQNRIATKEDLYRRRVLDQELLQCIGDCGGEELLSRLFFKYPIFASVWYAIRHWLDIATVMPKETLAHQEQFADKKWDIHLQQRNMCKMVEEANVTSWNLLNIKTNNLDYNVSQWSLNPRACLGLPWPELIDADLKISVSAAD